MSINLDFLRSGRQFAASGSSSGDSSARGEERAHTASPAQRLERFHKATLRAAADAASASSGLQSQGSGPAMASAPIDIPQSTHWSQQGQPSTPPTMVNLDFLRSGLEFREDAARMAEPTGVHMGASPSGAPMSPRSTYRRLEEFHKRTLQAAEAAARAAHERQAQHGAVGSPPTMVNLDFLRSGLEFREDAARMAEPTGMHMGASPSGAPMSPRSTYRRLEEFHKRTLQAAEAAAMSTTR